MVAANPWTPLSRVTPRAKLRLFLFPHGGGGASMFRPWHDMVPPAIDLVPLQLPGHEERIREPLQTDVHALADQMVEAVQPLLDRPCAAFGHSMGGLLAFEFVRRLRRRGVQPVGLFVAACFPPHTPLPRQPIYHLPDDEFVQAVDRLYSGLPPEVVGNAELMKLLLPIMRADATLIETYRYEDEPPLDCPITTLAGSLDRGVQPSAVAAWAEQTASTYTQHLLVGDHFFPKSSLSEVWNLLHLDLEPHL